MRPPARNISGDPKPFATPNQAYMCCAPADSRQEQDISFPLMISLVMIMFHVLIESTIEGRFSKQNQTRETLLLDGSDPPLRIGDLQKNKIPYIVEPLTGTSSQVLYTDERFL
jgi:hypothetical protein